MLRILKPAHHIHSLDDLDLNYWYQQGIRGILIDLDNTITPWRKNNLTKEAHNFFNRAIENDIKVVLFTNAREERAIEIAKIVNIKYFALAKKPFPGKYKAALSELKLKPDQTLAIGDQIFTDTLGGNLAGCTTILLPPLESTEFVGTKILRFMEGLIGASQKPRS